MPNYEAVIGLEVHAQLATRTKIFCGCSTAYGGAPNAQTCPVCLGHPGTLPVLNRRAVELAVRGALALGCSVRARSVFARKNYLYPDLPKGYQISQYDEPLATGGEVTIELDGEARAISLERLHLEEDAGKSIHDGLPDSDRASYVDLNRAGVPLIEIVSRPDLRSPSAAYLYLQRLRSILRYTEVCDGNMEQGSLRCDANISLRRSGARELGTRTELKNLNSFRNVERALTYEIQRQSAVVAAGGTVRQETVLWDVAAGATRPMRGKERPDDYRYFPEPDLPPLALDEAVIAAERERLPELPAARKQRLATVWALGQQEAHTLSLERELADYYEAVAERSGNPQAASHFILNDLLREHKHAAQEEGVIPLPAEHLAELIRLVDAGTVSVSAARQELFPEMYRTGQPPGELVRSKGLVQVSDEEQLAPLIRRILAEHPTQVEQYRAGKHGLLGYLVGQVMQASGGKANPRTVRALLEREIAGR